MRNLPTPGGGPLPPEQQHDLGELVRAVDVAVEDGLVIPCRLFRLSFVSDRAAVQQRAAEQCLGCPVCDQCQSYALHWREPSGVWGGTTSRDRQAES